jgi:hypothetical protein
MYHLKRNPTTITYCGTKIKSEAGPPRVTDSPNLPRVTLVARPLLTPVARKLCRCEHDVFTVLQFMKRLEIRFLTRKYGQVTKQLKLRPYRFQAAQQLHQCDTAARIQYCRWFHRFVREGVYVLSFGLRFKWNTLFLPGYEPTISVC